jgi:hypothetical protein
LWCYHALQLELPPAAVRLCSLLAARLKLGLQQRQQKQQKQQQQQQHGVAAAAAATAGLISTPAAGHMTRFKGTSSMRFKPAGSSSGSKQSTPAVAAAGGLGGALNATAPAAVARGPVLQAGFQLQQHQHVAASAATAASTAWNFTGRQPTAAVARGGDGEPAYFNVDELKHDLERALRKVG